MKINTHNFLGDRFSLISDINWLINIDYIDWYRLYRLLVSIDWARRGYLSPGLYDPQWCLWLPPTRRYIGLIVFPQRCSPLEHPFQISLRGKIMECIFIHCNVQLVLTKDLLDSPFEPHLNQNRNWSNGTEIDQLLILLFCNFFSVASVSVFMSLFHFPGIKFSSVSSISLWYICQLPFQCL